MEAAVPDVGGAEFWWAEGRVRGLKVRPWAVFINTDTRCFAAAWDDCGTVAARRPIAAQLCASRFRRMTNGRAPWERRLPTQSPALVEPCQAPSQKPPHSRRPRQDPQAEDQSHAFVA